MTILPLVLPPQPHRHVRVCVCVCARTRTLASERVCVGPSFFPVLYGLLTTSCIMDKNGATPVGCPQSIQPGRPPALFESLDLGPFPSRAGRAWRAGGSFRKAGIHCVYRGTLLFFYFLCCCCCFPDGRETPSGLARNGLERESSQGFVLYHVTTTITVRSITLWWGFPKQKKHSAAAAAPFVGSRQGLLCI